MGFNLIANNCSIDYPELSLKIDLKRTLFDPKVYPNPNNNILYIDNEAPFKESLLVKVYNIEGKTVYKKKVKKNESSLQIMTRNWHTGLYIVTLSSKLGVFYKSNIVITD